MNSKDLGELASDQKIQNVFRAFGYSIPVGKDGRRLWPTKFKNAIGQRMRSGELSVGAVQRTCKVSDKTAYKWRKDDFRKKSKSSQKTDQTTPAFAEITVREDNTAAQRQSSPIIFRRAGCELILPGSYSITDIVRLIQAFENQS